MTQLSPCYVAVSLIVLLILFRYFSWNWYLKIPCWCSIQITFHEIRGEMWMIPFELAHQIWSRSTRQLSFEWLQFCYLLHTVTLVTDWKPSKTKTFSPAQELLGASDLKLRCNRLWQSQTHYLNLCLWIEL